MCSAIIFLIFLYRWRKVISIQRISISNWHKRKENVYIDRWFIYIRNGHIFYRTIYDQLVTFRYFSFSFRRFPGFIFPPQATVIYTYIRICYHIWDWRNTYVERKTNIFSLCAVHVLSVFFSFFFLLFRFYEGFFFVTFCE